MAETPRVSVILTSYNHANYLREAIDSVLQQTFTDFEFIICDDASSDESWAIIQSYSDPRIQAFRNETRQKGGNLRRAMLQGVKGEYIAIHHSDDVWEPQKLETQVTFLDLHPQIGAVFTNVLVIGEDSQPLAEDTHSYQKIFDQPNRSRFEWLNRFFYYGNVLCHPSIMIRKKCYQDCGLYRYGFAQLTDFDMWVRLCLKYEIHVLPEKLLRLRIRSNAMNASGNRPDTRTRMPFETLQILSNYRKIQTSEEFLKVFPKAEKYVRPEGFEPDFALAMTALEPDTPAVLQLFGLQILFDALNDPEKGKRLQELYGFGHADFITLTGSQDVFSIEQKARLITQVKELASLNTEKDKIIKALSALISEIQSSRAWKVISAYRDIRAKLFSGSVNSQAAPEKPSRMKSKIK
jgi:glycosyltransferase involved in cell wall biosynthesis